MLLFAWTVVRDEFQAQPIVVLAQRIESGRDVDRNAVLKSADRALAVASEGRCESSLVKAGLTVLLRRLDLMDPVEQAADFALALGQARAYIDHALTCTPTDGNLWLRRAMIYLAERRTFSLVAADMAQSRRFAPAEAKILAGRFAIWNEFPVDELRRYAPILLGDLETICRKPNFMASLPKAGPSLHLFLDEQIHKTDTLSLVAASQKMRRVDQNKNAKGPGLWCAQLFPSGKGG